MSASSGLDSLGVAAQRSKVLACPPSPTVSVGPSSLALSTPNSDAPDLPTTSGLFDGSKARRKSSAPYSTSSSGSRPTPVRSSTMSAIQTSPKQMEEDIEPTDRKKARSGSSGSTPVLTSG